MSRQVKCYQPQKQRRSTVKLRTVPVRIRPGWKAMLVTLLGIGLVLFVSQKTALQQLNYRIASLETQQGETIKKLRNAQLHYQQLVSFQQINLLATTKLGMVSRNSQPVVITVGEVGHDLHKAAIVTASLSPLTMRE